MYLYAETMAPQGSALFQVIEDNVSPQERDMLNDPQDYLYVSGWSHSANSPLYDKMVAELAITPTPDSPHVDVTRDESGDGYVVKPCIFYWRKANAIHRWFVEHVQYGMDDCRPYPVHPELILDLIDRCQRVTVDHSLAPELLPSQGGFFFGSTEYDDWYFQDVEETAIKLKQQLSQCIGMALTYQSSW